MIDQVVDNVKAMDFYSEFECIGGSCPNSCCQGWTIVAEQKILDMHRTFDKANGSSFSDAIIATDKGYELTFSEDGNCNMMTSEGLCQSYILLGNKGQSITCQTFPRSGREYGVGEVELYMSIACPVVTDLAIFRADKLSWVGVDSSDINKKAIAKTVCKDRQAFYLMDKLKSSIVRMVQSENAPIDVRLMALLLMSSKLDNVDYRGGGRPMIEAASFFNGVVDDRFRSIPSLPSNLSNQFSTLIGLLREFAVIERDGKYANSKSVRSTLKILDESLTGIGVFDFDKIDQSHFEHYVKAQEQYIVPLISQHPYIIENLYSHFLMVHCFPFGSDKSPTIQLSSIIIFVLLVLGVAGGYANFHGQLDDKMLRKIIYTFSGRVNHNRNLNEFLLRACTQVNDLGLGHLYTLMRFGTGDTGVAGTRA